MDKRIVPIAGSGFFLFVGALLIRPTFLWLAFNQEWPGEGRATLGASLGALSIFLSAAAIGFVWEDL